MGQIEKNYKNNGTSVKHEKNGIIPTKTERIVTLN